MTLELHSCSNRFSARPFYCHYPSISITRKRISYPNNALRRKKIIQGPTVIWLLNFCNIPMPYSYWLVWVLNSSDWGWAVIFCQIQIQVLSPLFPEVKGMFNITAEDYEEVKTTNCNLHWSHHMKYVPQQLFTTYKKQFPPKPAN